MNPPPSAEAALAAAESAGLLHTLRTARAIRRLRPDPVPPELIRAVCEAGTFAPSGGNRQPWRFVAVTDPERRAYVAERYRKAFGAYIQTALDAARTPDFPDAVRRNIQASVYLSEHLHEVPVHLFVAGWLRRGEAQPASLYPAVQNVLLTCRALGLGASLTTAHSRYRDEIDPWLGLPESCPSACLIPIGWPLGKHGRPPRRPVDEVLFWERWNEEEPQRGRPCS